MPGTARADAALAREVAATGWYLGHQAVQVAGIGKAPAVERPRSGGSEEIKALFGQRCRVAVIGAGQHTQHQGGVGNCAGHRSGHAGDQHAPGQVGRMGRDPAKGGPDADDAVETGRPANRAAEIGAQRQGSQAAGHRRPRDRIDESLGNAGARPANAAARPPAPCRRAPGRRRLATCRRRCRWRGRRRSGSRGSCAAPGNRAPRARR